MVELSFGTPKRIGRYEVLRPIGSGGMGEVFMARTRLEGGIEKRVAIKRIHPHLAEDDELAEMFLEEARLSTVLEHPNIVHVSEVGRDDGNLFLVMSYLEGASVAKLSRRIAKHRSKWPVGAAIEVMMGVLAGLSHAHGRRGYDGEALAIVHRDVSPQNIFLTFDGGVKVLDFGIAKAANSRVVTVVGQRKGKSGYMAPEQERGLAVDARADVFSAGVVLYEMLTGQKPYAPSVGIKDRFVAQTSVAPHSVASLRSNVPEQLDSVLRQALASDPRRRFQTASAFRDALEDVCHEASLSRGHRAVATLVQRFAPRGSSETLEELPTRIRTPTGASRLTPAEALHEDEVSASHSNRAQAVPQPAPRARPPRRVGGILAVVAFVAVGLGALAFWGWRSADNRDEESGRVVQKAASRPRMDGLSDRQLETLLAESRPEQALDPETRARLLEEWVSRRGDTTGVDLANQTTLDLLQVARAEAPCELLDKALDRVQQNPDRRFLSSLISVASWSNGAGKGMCPESASRLGAALSSASGVP